MSRAGVALLIFLFTLTLHAQIDQNLDNRFRLAQSYEQAGQPERAEAILRELLEKQSWNASFFEALNRVLVAQKKYAESIEAIEKRLIDYPQDINLYGMLGSTYYMSGNAPSAFSAWERGIATNPNSYIVYRVIANYAIENRVFDKAIEILKKGKSVSQDPTLFSHDLANIYATNMKFAEAINEFAELLILRPEQSAIIKQRISNYISRPGAAEETIAALEKIIKEKGEKFLSLWDLLSYVYNLNGESDKAFDAAVEYEKLIKSGGNAIFIFAQEAFRNRQYVSASRAYKYVIDNYPLSPLIPTSKIGYAKTLEAGVEEKFNSASISWKPIEVDSFPSGQFEPIIEAYKKLADDYPDNSVYIESVYRIAEIYRLRLKDAARAESYYKLVLGKGVNTIYYPLALLGLGKIAIANNNLEEAAEAFNKILVTPRTDASVAAEANFFIARIKFWRGLFEESAKGFKEVSRNLSTDFSNDAIELSVIISTSRRDSLNLLKYALGERLLAQNKLKEAAIEFKALAENVNLFIINEFALYKLAEIFTAEDRFNEAALLIEKYYENSKTSILADKATFLLAKIYHFGLKEIPKAISLYQKLLEIFPDSLYFEQARELLNELKTKNG